MADRASVEAKSLSAPHVLEYLVHQERRAGHRPFPGRAARSESQPAVLRAQNRPPHVCATIQLDGADMTVFHLIQEVPPEEVPTGMRVEAVWVEDEDLQPTMESIKYFRPVRVGGDGHA